MRTYRVEFAQGPLSGFVTLLVITVLCFTVIGLPLAIGLFPTLYRIVEEGYDSE